MVNLSKICSRNNRYYSLILCENIAILAINSNRINLEKKNEIDIMENTIIYEITDHELTKQCP